MTEPEVFILSQTALKKVVDQIKDDQWDLPAPPEMTFGGKKATVRDLINWHAYDDAWVGDVLAGKTKQEVGDKYDGDLLGKDPKASYAKYNQAASDAAKDFTDLEKQVYLSYGDFPAKVYFDHITLFRGFRVVDIARLIGVDDSLGDELTQGLWDEVVPEVDNLRKMGVFGEEVKVAEDAPLQERLLGLSGRQPKA